MRINIDEKYKVAIITLEGDLTGGESARQFRETIYELTNDKKNRIVVDMTDVKYINSVGISVLISGYSTVKKAGGELKLAGISDKVNAVLNITKLNLVFHIYNLVSDGIRSFGAPSESAVKT